MNDHPAKNEPVTLRHNVAERRFEAIVSGQLALADYELQPGTMVLTHTLVPLELRGRGLAETLVRAALDHARAEKLKVVPACSYVGVFLQRHPEYQDLAS